MLNGEYNKNKRIRDAPAELPYITENKKLEEWVHSTRCQNRFQSKETGA